MIERIHNRKAWFMVLPVILLVAFNAVIPLMTVVNYSVQETFGNNFGGKCRVRKCLKYLECEVPKVK